MKNTHENFQLPDSACPQVQYQQLWQEVESRQNRLVTEAGTTPIRPAQLGRRCTLDTKSVKWNPMPPRPGRKGEVVPAFYGQSKQHAMWLRQLRRLQSLARELPAATNFSTDAVIRRTLTWQAIRRAKGFAASFSEWWPFRPCVNEADPARIPQLCPEASVAEAILLGFQANFSDLEASLNRDRIRFAKDRRKAHPSLVFQDISRPRAKPVDIFLTRTTAVSEVDYEESALCLETAGT